MKATGIVRCMDDLGRLCIPKELRKTLDISVNDSIEIFTEDDTIILRKYDKTANASEALDKLVCRIIADNPENRQQLLELAKDMKALLGKEN